MNSLFSRLSLKRWGKMGIKILFISALLYFLIKNGFLSLSSTQQALQKWEIIIPAFLLYLGGNILSIFRWRLLLQAQGMNMPWFQVFQLTFIGNFFNIALPGAISGDFVKAFYIGKILPGQRSKALGSILFDRVAGVSALVLVSAVAFLFGINQFSQSSILSGIQVFLSTSAVCVLIFYSYLFLVKEKYDPILKLLGVIETKIPKISSLTQVYTSLKYYHHHRITVALALAFSILIQLSIGFCCFKLAQALGDTSVSLLSMYLVVPLGLLITTIPIAPAGVGTGNVAFLYLFHLLGSDRGGDTFSLLAIFNLTIGALGGLIYLRYQSTAPRPSMTDEMSELERD